jgi:hypothetical protein
MLVWRWLDTHWPLAALLVAGVPVFVGLVVWDVVADGPVFLARVEPTTRATLYGSVASSSGALLGLVIASIAILLTLDERRERVREMQSLRAWRVLNVTLLAAAGFLAATLAASTIALGIDTNSPGCNWVEATVVSLAATAFTELVVGGLAFALVVLNLVVDHPSS